MASNSKLPQEIIADILTRLPAKSIGRFRCVSKPWRALLTHPHFIKTHLNRLRNLQQESLLLLSESSHCFYAMTLNNAHHLLDEMPLDPKRLSFAGYPDNWTEILASCDGLVLVCDRDDKKFLINPTTREVKEVPVSPFALNPCASFTMHGIGENLLPWVSGGHRIAETKRLVASSKLLWLLVKEAIMLESDGEASQTEVRMPFIPALK